ncbi:MAG: peptidoglycan-binding protein [Alphaproteobacteria bacterium]|nr:peptidoglycan-binding protein [Alphaproteobacteria bacterium]
MSLFSFRDFGDFLKGAVGNNLENDPDDVKTTKYNLSRAGYFDEDDNDNRDNGFITRKLDSSISRFQRDNKLKEDGVLFPGGETERTIFKTLEKRDLLEIFGGDDNDSEDVSIGFGGDVLGTIRRQMSKVEKSQEKESSSFSRFGHSFVEQNPDEKVTIKYGQDVSSQSTDKGHSIWNKLAQNQQKSIPTQYDATGRMIRSEVKETVPVPGRKPVTPERIHPKFDLKKAPVVNLANDRVDSLLNNTPAKFNIKFKKTDKILKEAWIDTAVRNNDIARKTVDQHSETVEKFSKKHGADPDLVKAIMWDENARGDKWGFNRLLDPVSSSQRPMNIKGSMWSGLIGKESGRLHNSEENIEASVILIKRISDRVEKPTPGEVASIWNAVGRENTNEFGNDVDIIYNQKPWTRKK